MVQTSLTVVNLQDLQRAMREVPRELGKEVRRELRPIANEVKADAARNASWSRRIPRSLSVRIQFGRRPSVRIEARRQIAPHARPFEGAAGKPRFRHPVFGNRDRWVNQATRPYLLPAIRSRQTSVARRMRIAVERAVARHGLR